MADSGSRRGRAHDAEGAREAILSAAEEVFAEHGFDGARIEAIAKVAGYNKSLLFQYFGDKLGLYAAVLKRADRELTELQAALFAPLLEDESIATDASRFKALLQAIVMAVFDYLVVHPRLTRMMLWEQAEGWQMYAKIVSDFATQDMDQFELLFSRARSAGLLRSSFKPVIQFTMVMQLCQSYMAFLPLYQLLLPGENVSSAAALTEAREYIVGFVVHGMLIDP